MILKQGEVHRMKNKITKRILIGVGAVAALLLLGASVIVTYEDEYKLIRQFGKVQRTVSEAGVSFKVPFIQNVNTIPKDIQLYDLAPSDVITSDKKTMVVDSYVLWRVTDPLRFAQTLSFSVVNAENRIDTIIYNATKNAISNMTQEEVIRSRDGELNISEQETEITGNDLMVDEDGSISESQTARVKIKSLTDEIMDNIGEVYEQYGIEIVTVQVKKLDLPDDNKEAVYTRMVSERENIAAQYTAEGEAAAQVIRNTTDKEVAISISRAEAEAEKIVAEGEAQYMKILSDAYNDKERSEFYSFVRSLDAARNSLVGDNKTLLLDENSPIAKIFAPAE